MGMPTHQLCSGTLPRSLPQLPPLALVLLPPSLDQGDPHLLLAFAPLGLAIQLAHPPLESSPPDLPHHQAP
jgi:hypothetical protein